MSGVARPGEILWRKGPNRVVALRRVEGGWAARVVGQALTGEGPCFETLGLKMFQEMGW